MSKCLGYKNYKTKQCGSRKAKKEPWELNVSEDHEGLFVSQLGLKNNLLILGLHFLFDPNQDADSNQ